MQLTFDPHNEQDCATVARLLDTTTTTRQAEADAWWDAAAAAVAETPRTATEQPEPETAAAEDAQVQPETDTRGMMWDADIHSTPASKNADGSWRARRGKKVVAAETGTAETGTAETMPNPASTAPATPPAPIDYKTMAERFVAKMADPDGLPAGYAAIYSALSIGYDDLETNQTSIARLSAYMDAVDNGEDHAGCVRHAMGEV